MEAIGWRDVVLVAVAAVAAYMALSIVRYFALGRRRLSPPPPPPPAEPALTAAPVPPAAPAPAAVTDAEGWPHTQAEFAGHLRTSTTELELKHLRGDLARMRDELSALGDELADLRKELDSLRASRHVSPLYGEAMTLALQGLDARAIAERCGISIGEAELVLALSLKKSSGGKDDEDDHERK